MMLVVLIMIAAAPQAPATASDQKANPIICTALHTGDEVGTRLQPKKVCMKKSEREMMQKMLDSEVQQYVNNGADRGAFLGGGGR